MFTSFTSMTSKAKKYLIVLMGIIAILAPVLVEAHGGGGGGGGGCCGQNLSYSYGSYLNYPLYYQSAGRNGNAFSVYPGYSYYPAYSTSYSAYPTVLNSALPSAYSGVYNLNQPYLLGNTFTSPLWGNTGYSYPVGQVTSNDYTIEQSRTTYVPGGEVTTTVSQGTETTTVPQYSPFLSTSYNPYTLGAGTSWMNLTGFGGVY
jgi:hypothetical protein